jgi:hypothetical protein
MTTLADFVHQLLWHGRAILTERPAVDEHQRAAAVLILTQAFADYRLDVAGPPIEFDARTALAAAELVREACWFLVNRDEPETALEQRLAMPNSPTTPEQHLVADLLFRFLPQLHRRARALASDDALTRRLATILRQWPLSGALSDVEEGPLTPLDFGGHRGLMMLYAERLAGKDRLAWLPEGPGREHVELAVWASKKCAKKLP